MCYFAGSMYSNTISINFSYYIFNLTEKIALDHWQVEISTHWPNLASTILKQLAKMAT
jgi:hypothetical protein